MKNLLHPDMDQLLDSHLDITNPGMPVEVKVSGNVIWVNVGPVCVLRICRNKEIIVEVDGKIV